jgi:hypothetical protein
LQEAANYRVINALIDLGSDQEVAAVLLDAVSEYGAKHVVHTLFSSDIPSTPGGSGALIPEINHHEQPNVPGNHIPEAIGLLTVRDVLESAPTIKYFANNILQLNIKAPELSTTAWTGIHFILGSTGGYIISTVTDISPVTAISAAAISSATYMSKLELYENMSQHTGLYETIGMQMALSLVNSGINKYMMPELGGYKALGYDMMISAAIGGMKYYQDNYHYNIQDKSILEVAIPYLADIATMYVMTKNIHITNNDAISYMIFTKQALAAISGVVTVDYMSKMAISIISDYVNSDYINECKNSFMSYFANGDSIVID